MSSAALRAQSRVPGEFGFAIIVSRLTDMKQKKHIRRTEPNQSQQMAEIVQFHPKPSTLAGFLRIGYANHKKLEALQAAGRLPYRRVVFEAAHLARQVDLLSALKANGCEIVLDPNFAEMAAEGCWRGAVRHLPWANPDRPWQPSDFSPGRNADLLKPVAEFCVRYGVSAVLAPTHLIESEADHWQAIDKRLCQGLRAELDRQGGGAISIDYQLLTTNTLLRDDEKLQRLIGGLVDLPIENIWLRVCGFGATATGVGTCHFIKAARTMHPIGRPLVADYAGGFAALACLAFGAVGGVCHGAGQKESFNAYSWKHPPSSGGGSKLRVYVPELDRHFYEDQITSIFASRGGRSRFACNDTSCCRSGVDDMINNADSHFIFQRNAQIESLSAISEARREDHFLRRLLDPAVRSARRGARLRISDEKVAIAIDQARSRLVRLGEALAELDLPDDVSTRSRPLAFRGGGGGISAILGR